MPFFVGVEERDNVVYAIVTSYLVGAADGWDWYVDDVEAWLGGDLRFGVLIEPARRMGAITARMHAALTDMQPSMVDLVSAADQAMVVTDFDGNPLLDSAERARPQSPLRDVASMLQSIAHVAAIAVKRRCPDRAADVDRFTVAATAEALDAYSAAHRVDHRLLLAFRVSQELHEYAYSIHHLPHWRHVADAALPRLLGLR